jgi:phytoene dehydrogenase-like protein
MAAAIVLAQAGFGVTVYEAESVPGGGARTLPLTLPGFLHDFGSAVHPLAIGSPFFCSLPLQEHGLRWIHSPVPLAHPLDDGTGVVLRRDLDDAAVELGPDGRPWRQLLEGAVDNWADFARYVLGPLRLPRRHPVSLARFGLNAIRPAESLARSCFHQARTRALFAGIAAHSALSLEQPLTAGFALVLAAAAHAVGWPIPRSGSQSITSALVEVLRRSGGALEVSRRIDSLSGLAPHDLYLCDVTPRQLLRLAADRLSPGFKLRLAGFRYGPGIFKVDYALREPIPWKAAECRDAITIHLGGSLEEIAEYEAAVCAGRHAERPFMILAQPSLFDPTRAPEGKHTAWAYCHVPHGSDFNMLDRMESQIERYAPGFRDCVLARSVFPPARLEQFDANLVGGDHAGGAGGLRQFLFRPTARHYATSARDIFICSSSTPPGPGVHGMCGYLAAQLALRRHRAHAR